MQQKGEFWTNTIKSFSMDKTVELTVLTCGYESKDPFVYNISLGLAWVKHFVLFL